MLVDIGVHDANRVTIFVGVSHAVGHRHVADVRQTVDAEVLVFTVDLIEAGLVVRRTVAEEGTELGVVEDKGFGTEEAGAEVDVHRVLRAFSFSPVTDAGSPDAGATVVNFSGATFTHAASLIHDRAGHSGGVHDESIAGRGVEVIVKGAVRVRDFLFSLSRKDFTRELVAGSLDGSSDLLFVGSAGELFERNAILLLHGDGGLIALAFSLVQIKEDVVGLEGRRQRLTVSREQVIRILGLEGTGQSVLLAIPGIHERGSICTFKRDFELLGTVEGDRVNDNIGSRVDGKRAADIDFNLEFTLLGIRAVKVTLLRELVVVARENAKGTMRAHRNRVVGADGFGKSEQRATFNLGFTLVGVVTGHDERTRTVLGKRALVNTNGNRILALLVIGLTPFKSLILGNLLIFDADDIKFAVEHQIANEFLFSFSERITKLVGATFLFPLSDGREPCIILGLALLQGFVGNVVGPNVIAVALHVVDEVAKELTRTIHALVEIGHTPTVANVDLAFTCRPAFKLRTIRIRVACSREHDVSHLKRIHLVIAVHEDSQSARHVRRSHGGAGAVAPKRSAGVDVNLGGVNVAGRSCDSPPLGVTGFVEHRFELVLAAVLLHAGNSNPELFGNRIEIRIERTIEGLGEVTVAGRKDLNNLLVLNGFIGSVNKGLAFPVAIRILTRFGVLHEEEVFILGLRNGIRREVSGRVATIGTNRRHVFAAIDANVGAKGIVDEAAARSIVGKLVGIRNCGRKSAPTLIEELRILERTVVGVVGAARVAHVDIGVKGNAVEFGTVTIAANRTGDVRTVGVVHAKFKLTAGRNLVTGLVGAGILGVLRITVAR